MDGDFDQARGSSPPTEPRRVRPSNAAVSTQDLVELWRRGGRRRTRTLEWATGPLECASGRCWPPPRRCSPGGPRQGHSKRPTPLPGKRADRLGEAPDAGQGGASGPSARVGSAIGEGRAGREASVLADGRRMLTLRADALLDPGRSLRLAARRRGDAAARQALALTAKGGRVSAARAQPCWPQDAPTRPYSKRGA